MFENCNEHKIFIHITFVDYQKQFDYITQNAKFKASARHGVPIVYINILKDVYKGETQLHRLRKY